MERQNNNMMAHGMGSMQRPQPGNHMQQIYAHILNNLRSKAATVPQGWQSTYEPAQRAGRIMQLVTALRMLQQDQNKCVSIAENFEERCFNESPTKDMYMQRFQAKLLEVQAKRTQQAQQLPPAQMGGMHMNNGNMSLPQNDMGGMNMMQNMGMGMGGGMNNMNMNAFMNGGANMVNGGMGNQNGQQNQGFPAQLQRPMQASPLPQQHQPQAHQNNTLDPAALQNPQMPAQFSNMARTPSQQQQANVDMNAQVPINPPTTFEISELAKKLFAQTPEEKRNAMRAQILSQYPQQRQDQANSDPIVRLFMMQARDILVRRKQLGQGNLPANNNNNNNGVGGASMQQTPSQGFDLTSVLGQQANAIKLQESGEQVVPASNNPNLPFGGQNNLPQSMNPQMLNNPNGQNAQNLDLQKLMAAQREKQRQLQIQQNQFAHSQAMAQQQAQQLRGQPGGLTPNVLNGGQANSPAMNMLNRPMVPPGQQAPPTPQPGQGPNATPNPANGANQVMQHHQNMLNQNSHQMGQNQPSGQMIDSLPQQVRDRLAGFTPQQTKEWLARWSATHVGGMMNNGQPGMGLLPQGGINPNNAPSNNQQRLMSGMSNGSAIPGFNSQPPANQQQAAMNDSAAQQRLQQQQQMRIRALDMRPFPREFLEAFKISVPDGVTEWGKLKQHIVANSAVLPPDTLSRVQQAQARYFEDRPDEVRMAMQALHQHVQRMQAAQGHMAGVQAQRLQQQQGPGTGPPSLPNGQAPPAQMVPPNAVMQQQQQQKQQQNMNAGMPNRMNPNQGQNQMRIPQLQPPSQIEIQRARQSIPSGPNMTDEQIRNIIMKKNLQQAQQLALAAQQQKMTNQMQRAQGVPGGAQQGNLAMANAQQQQQQQQHPQPNQRPPQAQPQQTSNKQQQQQAAQTQGQKRPKPANDDVMEIPNPNLTAKNAAQQAPAKQAGQPPQRAQQGQPPFPMRFPTPAELEKMNPEQKLATVQKMRQLEAARKAQQAASQQASQSSQGQNKQQPQQQPQPQQAQMSQPQQGGNFGFAFPANDDDRNTILAMYREISAATQKGAVVTLGDKDREVVMTLLKSLFPHMQNLEKTFSLALRVMRDKLREAMQCRIIYFHNVSEIDGSVNQELTVSPAEVLKIRDFVNKYYAALRYIKEKRDANAQSMQQQQQQQQGQLATNNGANAAAQQSEQQQQQVARPQQPAKPQQPASLERKPSQQGGRKASASSKAPPAPTENKSFDWNTIQSSLTPDKLKFPAQKKRKTDHDSPDARASRASPSAAPTEGGFKPQQPQQQQAPQPAQQTSKPVEPAKPRFKCDDLLCDASVVGFETEDLLHQHKDAEHKPVEDALSFFLEKAADALGLDTDGKEKKETKAPAAVKAPARPAPAMAKPANSQKGGVQTPGAKEGAATPATPASGSKGTTKPAGAALTPAGRKAAESSKAATAGPASAPEAAEQEKEKTLLTGMAGKIGFQIPPTPPSSAVPEISLDPPGLDSFPTSLGDALAATAADDGFFLHSLSDVPLDVDWGCFGDLDSTSASASASSPPSAIQLTPSDRSLSSQGSEVAALERLAINMRWDPCGNGDVGVPEGLARLEALRAEEEEERRWFGFMEDAVMVDGEGDGEGRKDGDGDGDGKGEGKKKEQEQEQGNGFGNWDEDLIAEFCDFDGWQGGGGGL